MGSGSVGSEGPGSGWGSVGTVGSGAVRVTGELASQRPVRAVGGKKRTRGRRRSPQELSVWRCWRPNSTRPFASRRATMRTSPTASSRGELASQRPTVAVGGKKRTRGRRRSPQELSVWRSWRPNSIRSLASLRATMRTSTSSAEAVVVAAVVSWPVAGAEPKPPLRTARRACSNGGGVFPAGAGAGTAGGTGGFRRLPRGHRAGSCRHRRLPFYEGPHRVLPANLRRARRPARRIRIPRPRLLPTDGATTVVRRHGSPPGRRRRDWLSDESNSHCALPSPLKLFSRVRTGRDGRRVQ